MSVVDKESPVYEVFDPSLNPHFSPIHDTNITSDIFLDNVINITQKLTNQNICLLINAFYSTRN